MEPQSLVTDSIEQAITALLTGKVIAYPTEAVYGLGCDLDNQAAVQRILQIKQRPVAKGMIIIAGDIDELEPYIDWSQLAAEHRQKIQQIPVRPTTWVMPASAQVPKWISGQFSSVAVRLSQHPTVKALCAGLGKPIVSTSANLAGASPALCANQAASLHGVDLSLDAPLGEAAQASQIIDILSAKVLRS